MSAESAVKNTGLLVRSCEEDDSWESEVAKEVTHQMQDQCFASTVTWRSTKIQYSTTLSRIIFYTCVHCMYICMYVCMYVFKRKPENWDHEGQIVEHSLEQRQWPVKGTVSDMRRNKLKPAVRRQRRGLCSSGSSAGCQTPDLIQPLISWNRFRISNCRCYPIRHFPQIWHPTIFTFLAPKRRHIWT